MSFKPTQFDHLTFPTYSYKEYPKIITLPDGKRVTVQTQHDEIRMLADAPKAPGEPHPAEKERDKLLAMLKEQKEKAAELEAKLAATTEGRDAKLQANADAMARKPGPTPTPQPLSAKPKTDLGDLLGKPVVAGKTEVITVGASSE
jgi:hypothetical protein